MTERYPQTRPARAYGPAGAGVTPIADEQLPHLVVTDWHGRIPLQQGWVDRDTPRLGYKTWQATVPGAPPAAAIWYREEDDTVVVHTDASRLSQAQRSHVEAAAAALRLQVARF